jgi:hypothetical protein
MTFAGSRRSRPRALRYRGVQAWAVQGVELPFGDERTSWWIDASGSIDDRPLADADLLPGRFFYPAWSMRTPTPPSGPGRQAW